MDVVLIFLFAWAIVGYVIGHGFARMAGRC